MIFYELQIGPVRSFVEGASQNDWETIICSNDPGHQRAGRRVTPLSLDILSWRVVDFSSTMLREVVITDRVLRALSEAGLTGFEVNPVKLQERPPGLKVPQLWEFVVTGKGGLAHKDSGIVELMRCEVCGLVQYSAYERGIQVNSSTYDGSDFFVVTEYPRHVLVTSRARDVIERARFTNVGFIESSSVVWPEGVLKPGEIP